ncbi:SMP-30/gluconolactonase/LRE family protein [Streptomyces sp. M2CJ-2]|uniref:SMP-30/gluconolactonase/LRE family protein n=1 Tax=Streptomyces sp. M2CJ-2 TaxID=2803948 RepID=UPI0019262ED9|nr:SMP-30/gluconolactonase/LRE family protein [Streptomyces sp. M2CJ-2]MBL3668069.1 SMP-30/gluconolactonase/LRE family protein [Streptomyces sp. M2CJ-2]
MSEFTTTVRHLTYPECPRWRGDRLYFSDFFTNQVLSVSATAEVRLEAVVPNQPGGLGFLPDGRMLFVSVKDRKIMRRDGEESVVHADLSDVIPHHLNDMVVDAEGRAYVGNMGFDLRGGQAVAPADLWRVDPDGSFGKVAENLAFPNGSVITPDGKTLVVGESFANRLTAFDLEDGNLSGRRAWANFGEPPATTDAGELLSVIDVSADGIALDAEGAIWVTDPPHKRVLRVAEGGRILAEHVFAEGAYACALGGPDRSTLYVCLAPTWDATEAAAVRGASIVQLPVDVPGAGIP